MYDADHPVCVLQVKQRLIYYLHDSSETTEDNFTLSASAFEIERSSSYFTVCITIQPVNDQPPKLVYNTGLEVTSPPRKFPNVIQSLVELEAPCRATKLTETGLP